MFKMEGGQQIKNLFEAVNSTKKNQVSMKPPNRFQVLTPKYHVKPLFFAPSFTETIYKKKRAVSP